MSSLQVILAPEQLAELADMIAERLTSPAPVTFAEAAKILGLSERTIDRMTEDGTLKRIPGTHRRLIPQSEIKRLTT